MAEKKQDIKYDMLEEHDQSLLKIRPLHNAHVVPLTKVKLISFLEGNDVPFNKYSYKEALVTTVVNFISKKETPVAKKSKSAPIEKIKTNFTATNEAKANSEVKLGNLKQPLYLPKASQVPAPKPKLVTPGASSVASTTTSGNTTAAIPTANHTVTSGSLNAETTKSELKPKAATNVDILQPCNALYIDNLIPAEDDDDWELPPPCSCSISIHDLIKYVPLPQNFVDLLQEMCTKNIQELTQHLQTFGDENAYSSGCRLYLLLQIRDLYEGEAKTLPGFTPGKSTLPNNDNIPKPSDGNSLQSLLGSKRKPTDAASTLTFPPPKPKVAKPSTVPSATVTSATVTSATVTSGSSSNQTASAATPFAINNSQPEAETTATKHKRLQAQTELQQDFSKMMSQQLGLVSGGATKAKIALFDDILEDSTAKECCICIASGREVAFVPCGHTVCCSACSAQLKDCPVCRMKIKTKLTLYYS